MDAISKIASGTVYEPASAAAGKETAKDQQPEAGKGFRPVSPATDEYIPEKTQAPEQASAPEGAGKKAPERKTERCVGDTGKVDREIEKLKREQEALLQQLNRETDEGKIRDLERKLAQVERELRQKDNDAYRRQHTVFS